MDELTVERIKKSRLDSVDHRACSVVWLAVALWDYIR